MAVAQEGFNFSSIPISPPIVSKKTGAHHRLESTWVGRVKQGEGVLSKRKEGLLIGPVERYSVGNLLTPHVLARALDLSKFRCAGMVRGDFSEVGGFPVRNYGESALEMGGSDLHLIHMGGTAHTESIVDAYSSVAKAEEADRFESLRMIGDDAAIRSYVRRRTGQLGDLAYLLAPEGEFFGSRTSFLSMSLTNFAEMERGSAERLISAMGEADFVGVRDSVSADLLEENGVPAHRMPSSLSILPNLCARQLKESRDSSAMDEVRHRFPNGWIAVEVGDLDDRHFDRLGRALHDVSEQSGLGLVFFDAGEMNNGGAPSKLRRWVEFHPEWEAAQFSSSNIWEVASLLLHAQLYCGGDLDCRIISMAGGVPRISLPTGGQTTLNYCRLWESRDLPIELDEEELWSERLADVLRANFTQLSEHARRTAENYFGALRKFSGASGIRLRY